MYILDLDRVKSNDETESISGQKSSGRKLSTKPDILDYHDTLREFYKTDVQHFINIVINFQHSIQEYIDYYVREIREGSYESTHYKQTDKQTPWVIRIRIRIDCVD